MLSDSSLRKELRVCPCYNPLKGFIIGKTALGKDKYKICSWNVDHVEIGFDGIVKEALDSGRGRYAKKVVRDYTVIRCNQCIGCRLDYSRQWADRCMCEASLHDESWFVTLTYDAKHLPRSQYIDADGVIHETATLVKRDFQLFMKRLREAYINKYGDDSNKLRYFACGEYGNKNGRPHYHAIIFGLHLDDLKIWKRTAPQKGGFLLYKSPFLERVWSVEKKDDDNKKYYENIGMVVIAQVSWATCAYTARYIMKKQKGDGAWIYDYMNISPEFTVMSRKPGIAREYYELHKDEYMNFHEMHLSTESGGKSISNIKYFDNIFAIEDEIAYNEYKEQRKEQAEELMNFKLSQTELSYPELLKVEWRNKQKQIAALKREL